MSEKPVNGNDQKKSEMVTGIPCIARSVKDPLSIKDEWQTTFDMVNDAIWILDKDQRILRTNLTAQKLFRLSTAEMIGKHCWEIVHGTDKSIDDCPYIKAKDSHKREMMVLNIGNNYFQVSIDPILDMNGCHEGALHIVRDISEIRQAEKRLEEKDKMLANLASQVPGVLFQFMRKPDGSYSLPYSSDGIRNLFGCSPDDIQNDFTPILNVVYPEDRNKFLQSIEESAKNLSQWRCEFRIQLLGEPIKWMFGNSIPEKKDDGSIIWSGYNIDITEQKQGEADRERLKSQLSNAVEMAQLGPWEYDVATDTFTFNDYFYKVFGTTAEEVGGYKMSSEAYARRFLHPDDMPLVQEGTRKAIETNDPNYKRRMEHRIIFPDGSIGHISVQVFIIKDADGNTIKTYGVNQDITERKRIEAELLKTQKLESIGMLAGGIAHDFNNILTAVLGNISMAKEQTEPKSEIFELLNDAETASKRAQVLTKQLLTYSKGGTPVKETASVKDIIRESSLFVTRGAKSRCEFEISEDLWPVEADIGQISQVINNIVINANQSMPDGGIIKIKAENHIINGKNGMQLPPGRYIRIIVKDDGIGIAEKYLSKIFDPYFTTKQQGSGLGLATAYSIVNKHNGTITVDSKLGVGSTFTVYLPASDKALDMRDDTSYTISGSGRILVMDDEEALTNMLEKLLIKLGYDAEFAKDGLSAIDMYAKARDGGKPYDLVILDLTVSGGMGGKEAIKKMLEIDKDIKAIVSSGYSDDPVLSNFREYGFMGMISKPYETKALSRVLHDVLNS